MNCLYQLNVMGVRDKSILVLKLYFQAHAFQFGKINSIPVDENHISKPETPYALHKQATPKICISFTIIILILIL